MKTLKMFAVLAIMLATCAESFAQSVVKLWPDSVPAWVNDLQPGESKGRWAKDRFGQIEVAICNEHTCNWVPYPQGYDVLADWIKAGWESPNGQPSPRLRAMKSDDEMANNTITCGGKTRRIGNYDWANPLPGTEQWKVQQGLKPAPPPLGEEVLARISCSSCATPAISACEPCRSGTSYCSYPADYPSGFDPNLERRVEVLERKMDYIAKVASTLGYKMPNYAASTPPASAVPAAASAATPTYTWVCGPDGCHKVPVTAASPSFAYGSSASGCTDCGCDNSVSFRGGGFSIARPRLFGRWR